MKKEAVFVFLVALVTAEHTRPTEKNTRRRGRQYEHFNHQGFDGGDGFYQGQEVAYDKVYQHHHGSPEEVQYQNLNTDVKSFKSKEIQLPDYGYENGQNQEVPLQHFQHAGPYDFQYENQVALQFGNKEPATFNLEYVPVTPSPVPVVYPSVETAPSPLPEGEPEKHLNVHVVPLKHAFPPEPNPFPIPERFQLHKNLVATHTKALPPPPPPPPPPSPPPSHVAPVKSVGFKLNLLKPLLYGSLPPPPAPLPSQEAYHNPPPPEDYFVPVPLPVVTKVPPPPPPPPKKVPPHPVAPLKKFFTNFFFKNFKLS